MSVSGIVPPETNMLPTHFYSDPHFGHENIIKHANRPFADIGAMNNILAGNYWYALRYCENPVVIWTGDCAWSGFDLKALLSSLPGHKILVRGNHDGSVSEMLRAGFDLVVDSLDLLITGKRCHVSHYPPRSPPKGQYAIHGHTHEKIQMQGRRIHVGVDAWDYFPVSVARIEKLIQEA